MNDIVIHSKLAVGGFPENEEVVDIIIKTANGKEPTKVTKIQSVTCAIL